MRALTLLVLCFVAASGRTPEVAPATTTAEQIKPDDFKPDPSWRALGKSLWFDPATHTVVLRAQVSLRQGYLEHLLCLERTKEHESIFSTDAPPRMIHAALILAVGEPGHPVRYKPEFQSPDGPKVSIEAEFDSDRPKKKIDARTLVLDEKSGKSLKEDWVFAGSIMFEDEVSKKVIYGGDGGDLITVANFPSAILDLPFASSNSDTERSFVAFTERLPERGTRATLYLRAVKPPASPKKP